MATLELGLVVGGLNALVTNQNLGTGSNTLP